MRRGFVLVATCLFLSASQAMAWDPDLHVAIFEAARQISPVLDSRFDPAAAEYVRAGLREADPADKACRTHRGVPGRTEAWTSAESLLKKLRSPHPSWTSRQKAQLFGAYLHFVADSMMPPVAIRDRLTSIPFDLAVFREKSPLQEPLAEALRLRGTGAFSAGSGFDAVTPAFRAAVNLSIEAALLAPLRVGAKEPEDVGPVVMVPVLLVAEMVSGRYTESARILHAGLHVLEWDSRDTPTGTRVRALVQNNLGFCVRHVFFRVDAWVGGMTASLPPQSLTYLDFPGPANSPDDVVTRFVPGDCPVEDDRLTIPLTWLRLAATDRFELRFDTIREFRPGDARPEPVGKAVFVEFLESEMEAMKGLEIPEFWASAKNDRVDFRFRVRNKGDRAPKPLILELEVSSTSRRLTELVEVKVDLAGLGLGEERSIQGFVPVKTHGDFTALRVFRIRRTEPPSVRKKTVKW